MGGSLFVPILIRTRRGAAGPGIVCNMTAPSSRTPLRIGEFVLDPSLNELARDQQRQRLPAKLVDLLLRLAAEPGAMVPRETLLEDVWERRLVNDEVLSRAIADLRQALGDEARAPRYIETVPKRGYRLVAPVSPPEAARVESVPAVQARAMSTPAPSVAAPTPPPPPPPRARRWLVPALALGAAVVAAAGWHLASRPTASWPPDPLTPDNLLRARPFTTEPGRELYPRFTPDGRWVIYTRAGGEGQPATLRLRAVDGTEDRVLAEGGGDNYCGTVSPDGATLAWLRARPGVCELVHRPLLGGPARVLAGCRVEALAGCPDWTPDGAGLVLGAVDDGATGLRVVAFPDGAETRLTSPPVGQHDFMPRYAPDGMRLVFWRGDSGGRALHRLELASGRSEPLRPAPQLAFGHAFAPDGSLLLADDSFGQRALLRVDARTGATPLLLGGSDARHPDVARDGGIVFEVARYDANLWRIELGPGTARSEPRQLTRSARYDSQPAVSPDGAWIAFGSNRDGREAVYLMRSDGSDERKLPLDPALRWTSPLWSPGADQLLVQRYEGDDVRLCLHAIAAGTVACPDTLGRHLHGALFLDDAHVAAVDSDSDAPRLHRIALADGARATIAGNEVVERCRANTRWLACHRPARPGLWLQDRASGEAREILSSLPGENRPSWALAEGAVYFASAGSGAWPRGVHRYDPERDEAVQVTDLWPSAIGDTISVAPDESFLVIARTDALETDLVYVPPPPMPAR